MARSVQTAALVLDDSLPNGLRRALSSYDPAMPAPIPARDRHVYFVGAGLSVAMGLPNTAMLLDGVLDLARRSNRWKKEGLEERLDTAFKYFYPDAINAG